MRKRQKGKAGNGWNGRDNHAMANLRTKILGLQRLWLKQNRKFKGWDSCVHREFSRRNFCSRVLGLLFSCFMFVLVVYVYCLVVCSLLCSPSSPGSAPARRHNISHINDTYTSIINIINYIVRRYWGGFSALVSWVCSTVSPSSTKNFSIQKVGREPGKDKRDKS